MIQLVIEYDEQTKNVKVSGNTKDIHPGIALTMLHAASQPFLAALQPKEPLVQAAPASALKLVK